MFLFSNVIDSTYGDGSHSVANIECGEWKICEFSAFVSDSLKMPKKESCFKKVTFGGKSEKNVKKGELFYSDEILLDIPENYYLGLKITFEGKQIPNHPENQIPCFREDQGEWTETKEVPLPSMVGCVRTVKKRITFWGDSITQGCGVKENSYDHYAAVTARLAGNEYAFWDIGIGYARAFDAASDGIWAYKAKHTDVCIICFGVNDIGSARTPKKILSDLKIIVRRLKDSGVRVVVQTIPPFEFDEKGAATQREVNKLIFSDLELSECLFDETVFLTDVKTQKPIYGGHPNQTGCAVWGSQLYKFLKEIDVL